MIDYALAMLLCLPWIFNNHPNEPGTLILGALGLWMLTYCLFTDYELGLIKAIPMRLHRIVDFLVGFFLLCYGFLFTDLYHRFLALSVGVVLMLLSVLTSSRAYRVSKNDRNITTP